MNRAQYLYRCALRKKLRENRRVAKKLEKLCRDPEEQHCWDDWVRAEERVSGSIIAIHAFDAAIRLGRKS